MQAHGLKSDGFGYAPLQLLVVPGFDAFDDLDGLGGQMPELQLAEPPKPKPELQKPKKKKKRKPTLEESINAWEISKLGDFGDAPSNPLFAAPYSLVVLWRLWEIRRNKESLGSKKIAQEELTRAALLPLGKKLAAHRDQLERYGELLPTIEEIELGESKAKVRAKQVELANAGSFHEREELQRKVALKRGRLGPMEEQASAHQARLNELETELARRAQVVQDAKGQLAGADDQDRFQAETALAGAEAEHAHQRDLTDAKRSELAPFMEQLDSLRKELRKEEGALERLEKNMAGPLAELRKLEAQSEVELESLHIKLADVALEEGIEPRNLEEVSAAKRARDDRFRLARDIKLHELALKAYDKSGFRNGMIVVGGAVLLILVVVLLLIFR